MVSDSSYQSKNKYVGASTDFLYYWDDEQGWIHVSEKEKLRKAYEAFLVNGAKMGMTMKLQAEADYFHELWRSKNDV